MPRPLIIVFLLFVAAIYPALDFAAYDIRMLQTFSLDEAAFANQVREMIDARTLEVDGFTYGSLYPYLGVLFASIWGLLFDITDTSIIVILRLISIGAALITAAVIYRTARVLYDEHVAWFAAALVLSAPVVYRWSLEIHPDLLQLCFLTCSLHFAIRLANEMSLKATLLASLFAGLAMGTKYGGAFMMPTLALALFLGIPGGLRDVLGDRRLWLGGLLSLIVFVTAYAVTNPFAVVNAVELSKDLEFAGRIVSDAEGDARSWLWTLFDPKVAAINGVGIAFAVQLVIRRTWLTDRAIACLLFWILTYLGFLLINVRFIASQYLLPVSSALALIVAQPMVSEKRRLLVRYAGMVFFLAVQSSFAWGTFAQRTQPESNNPVIAAGLWLSDTYPSNTTILYDTYAYVPSEFHLAETYFGLSYTVIGLFAPDLVVTRKSIEDRYSDPDQSDHFRLTEDATKQADFLYLDPQRYRDIHYTYRYLKDGITAYDVAKDFGDVTVYRRREITAQENKQEEWGRISEGQKGGGVEAGLAARSYHTFGDIHAVAGNWSEAKVQYGKAVSLDKSNIVPQYNYVLALAYQDSFDVAESVLDQMSGMTASPADLWLKLGWDYYQMGRYERSRQSSKRASGLAPDQPYPLYNIALTYLVEDRTEEAAQAYQTALEKHPLPESTADLLSQMIRDNNLQGESREIAKRVLSSQP
jgi:tetratricopeptide (TPR) repeat protein